MEDFISSSSEHAAHHLHRIHATTVTHHAAHHLLKHGLRILAGILNHLEGLGITQTFIHMDNRLSDPLVKAGSIFGFLLG